jgi:hypothetical protein
VSIALSRSRGRNGLALAKRGAELVDMPRKSGAGADELRNMNPDKAMIGTAGAPLMECLDGLKAVHPRHEDVGDHQVEGCG